MSRQVLDGKLITVNHTAAADCKIASALTTTVNVIAAASTADSRAWSAGGLYKIAHVASFNLPPRLTVVS